MMEIANGFSKLRSEVVLSSCVVILSGNLLIGSRSSMHWSRCASDRTEQGKAFVKWMEI